MTLQPQVATLSPGLAQPPMLRGLSHLGAAFAATAGVAWLMLVADSPTGYVGGAIFGSSLILLYWTSASYHRIPWTPTLKRAAKRLDHAMIFVLIAGTYTPFCLEVSLRWGIPLLAVVWSVAGVGTLIKVLWLDAPRWLGVSLYMAFGWIGVVAASEVLSEFAVAPLAMLALGGALYTLGGLVYALKRPNPWPRVFGYHEVFHLLVIAGSAVHYSLIAIYILPS